MTLCEYGNRDCCTRSKANATLNRQSSEHNGDHGLSDFCKIEYLSQRTCQILLDMTRMRHPLFDPNDILSNTIVQATREIMHTYNLWVEWDENQLLEFVVLDYIMLHPE